MKRTYENIFEIEAENVTKAINKLNSEVDKYIVELEQCCVVNEEIECIKEEEEEPPTVNKYAIISTWNGEGYSYLNTAEILEFKDDKEAQNHLRKLFESENDIESFEVIEKKGFLQYSDEQNSGTYIWIKEAELIYGIVIYPNVNEINIVLNAKEWRNYVAKAIKQAEPEEVGEIDLTQKSFFISAHNSDYDYQFIKF